MSGAGVQAVRVALPSRAYDLRVGARLLDPLGECVREALAGESAGGTPAPPKNVKRVFLAHDAGLPATFVDNARTSLAGAGFEVATAAVKASEEAKSLDTLARLLEAMAAAKLERSEPVIALGGGVVGDVAGFAASVYRRGVPVIQCPTTLLAMVDASVGGKTGVNLRVGGQLRKNMVGAFWQPALVLCDVAALDSLPERHLRAGLAECIKHALLAGSTAARDRLKLARDDELFEWTLAAIPRALARERDTLIELIARNVAVKASVVERDEREEVSDELGGRALLNLGHTFAHAIETLPGLAPANGRARIGGAKNRRTRDAPLLHGEAVGLGLIAAAGCAASMDLCTSDVVERVRAAVAAARLPDAVAGLPADDELIDAMTHDKKQRAGVMRLVLPTGVGTCKVVAAPPREAASAGWTAIRAS